MLLFVCLIVFTLFQIFDPADSGRYEVPVPLDTSSDGSDPSYDIEPLVEDSMFDLRVRHRGSEAYA